MPWDEQQVWKVVNRKEMTPVHSPKALWNMLMAVLTTVWLPAEGVEREEGSEAAEVLVDSTAPHDDASRQLHSQALTAVELGVPNQLHGVFVALPGWHLLAGALHEAGADSSALLAVGAWGAGGQPWCCSIL